MAKHKNEVDDTMIAATYVSNLYKHLKTEIDRLEEQFEGTSYKGTVHTITMTHMKLLLVAKVYNSKYLDLQTFNNYVLSVAIEELNAKIDYEVSYKIHIDTATIKFVALFNKEPDVVAEVEKVEEVEEVEEVNNYAVQTEAVEEVVQNAEIEIEDTEESRGVEKVKTTRQTYSNDFKREAVLLLMQSPSFTQTKTGFKVSAVDKEAIKTSLFKLYPDNTNVSTTTLFRIMLNWYRGREKLGICDIDNKPSEPTITVGVNNETGLVARETAVKIVEDANPMYRVITKVKVIYLDGSEQEEIVKENVQAKCEYVAIKKALRSVVDDYVGKTIWCEIQSVDEYK